MSDDSSTDENMDSDHLLKTKSSMDESYPLKNSSSVDKKVLKKLNKKYGPVNKNFVKGEDNSSETNDKKLKKKLDVCESKSEETEKKRGNRNGKIRVNKHTNYTPNASAPRKTCSKCGSVNHLSADCKTVIPPNLSMPMPMSSVSNMHLSAMNMMPGVLPHNPYSQSSMPYMFNPYFNAFNMPQFHSNFQACVVTKGDDNNVVLIGQRKGNVYASDFNSVKSDSVTCFLSKASSDDIWLLHKRLSRLNFKTINELVKKDLVRGIPKLEISKDGLCGACQQGKQKRSSFKSKVLSSIVKPIQLLHMDLFGPVNIMSISKKKYCLVIVDDFSKFTWTFFLHSKDKAGKIIINHIKALNNNPDVKVERIKSDNGTEFKNSVMKEFCEEKGIIHEFSTPRTPQQNGVVERKNRTLIEAAITMINEAQLPTYFWDEAVNTACFTQNISFITKTHSLTPFQLFKGKKPLISFLHVFGCKCYVLRNQVFDDKTIQGLSNEGFHDNLRLENEGEGDLYDSDDDCDDYIPNAEVNPGINIPMDETTAIENSTEASVETPLDSSVEILSQNSNQFRNNEISDLGGAFQHGNLNYNNEATSSRQSFPPQRKWTRDHPFELIIGDANASVQNRRATQDECLYSAFLSQDEPKVIEDALKDADWAQNGYSETKWMRMELSPETKQDLWLKGILNMKKLFLMM
ncbi:uncharacterized protein LOC135152146 [Daucus carota subsp. sativus]|uniref:uncharacterized protein LOC135152146 n=1 Tax=Daucus carota subsp. sativus TaxID=79200 RepID=UPI00308298DA